MEKVEDKKTCFFCRLKLSPTNVLKLGSMGSDTKTVLWGEKCAETLCEIFFGDPDHPIKIYFQNAAYCIRCQQIIWNIDFSWRQLLYLRERVDDLSLTLRKLLMANFKTIKTKAAIKKPDFEAANFFGKYVYDQVIQILRMLLINGDALSGVNVPMGRTPECQKGNSRRQERNTIEKVSSSKVNQRTMQCKECLKRQNEQEKNYGSPAKRPRNSVSYKKDVCTQTEKKKKTKSKKKKKDKELERKIEKIRNSKTEKYRSPVKTQSPRKSTKSVNIVNNNKPKRKRNIMKLPLQEANNKRKENIDIDVPPLVEFESCESTTYSKQSISAPVQINTSIDSKNSKIRTKSKRCRLRSDSDRTKTISKSVEMRAEADLQVHVPCDSVDTSTQLDIEICNENVVPAIKIDEIKHLEIEVLSKSDLFMVDLHSNTLQNSVTVSENVQAVKREDITEATTILEDEDVHDDINVNTNGAELPIVGKFSDTDTFQTVTNDEIHEVIQIDIESDTFVDTEVNIDEQCGQGSSIQSVTKDEMPDVIEMNVESDNNLQPKLNIKQSSSPTSAPLTTKTLLMPYDSSSDEEVLSVEKSTNKSLTTEIQVVTNAERTEREELHSRLGSKGICYANVNINTNEVIEVVELFSEDEHLKANDDFVEIIDAKMVSNVDQPEVDDEIVEVTDAEIVVEDHEAKPKLTQNINDSSFEIVQDDNGDDDCITITSVNDTELTSKLLEKPHNEKTHEIADFGAMCDENEETSEILEDEENAHYTSDNNSDDLFESDGGGDESNISDGEWDQVLEDSFSAASLTDDDDKSLGLQSSSEDDEDPPLVARLKPTVAVDNNKKEFAFLKNAKILTMPDDSSSDTSDSDEDNFKKKAVKSTAVPLTPTKQTSRAPVTPTIKQLVMPSDSSSSEDEDCLPKSKVTGVKKCTNTPALKRNSNIQPLNYRKPYGSTLNKKDLVKPAPTTSMQCKSNKPISTAPNTLQKFFCKLKNCGKSFELLQQLKVHLDTVHRD